MGNVNPSSLIFQIQIILDYWMNASRVRKKEKLKNEDQRKE
jgi:hypothetical protein